MYLYHLLPGVPREPPRPRNANVPTLPRRWRGTKQTRQFSVAPPLTQRNLRHVICCDDRSLIRHLSTPSRPSRGDRRRRKKRGQQMEISLDGKVALVTGAGPNIGSGIALALARYGAKVACNDLDLETSKAAVRRIARNGGEGLALSGDVSVEADVLANIAAVLDAWGRIDIVVNNAAWLHTNHILEEDLASFNRAITIAVSGNFLFTKHAALAMIARGIKDSIVSI